MSKACASREEAEATVAHYADKGQPAHIEEMAGRFLVKRTADNKVVQPLHTAAPPASPSRPNTTAISPAECRPPRALIHIGLKILSHERSLWLIHIV